MNRQQLQQMTTLLRREYWEHRITVLWVPVALAALSLISLVWLLMATSFGQELIDIMESLQTRADSDEVLNTFFGIAAGFFLVALSITVPIYLINCLYEDRKSGNSLFWYSMPVSNAKTVLSKLVTGLLVMPLVTAATMLALFLILLLIAAIYFTVQGASLPLELLLSALLDWTVTFTTGTVLLGLWLLPLYGWLLLVSAFARAVPVFWAIALIVVPSIFERIVLGSSYLSTWLDSRGIPYQNFSFDLSELTLSMLNYDMVYGLLLGCFFITGAIYMRRFTD